MNSSLWERIDVQHHTTQTFRLKVPGGWLVRVVKSNDDTSSQCMSFVCDPAHIWHLPSIPYQV